MHTPTDILLHSGMTLLEAYRVAQDAGMYLVTDGRSVVVAPTILPGWREVPIRINAGAPDSGGVCTDQQVAA